MRQTTTLVVLAAIAFGLGGCSTLEPVDAQPEQPVSSSATTLADGSVRIDTDDARVAQLWSAAEQARVDDDDAQSLELLYQALELQPQNAMFWSRAAEIQLDNEEPALAENFAVKSNAFAGNNVALLYRNWLIIEHARDVRGDLLGVRSAHRKVQEYQYR